MINLDKIITEAINNAVNNNIFTTLNAHIDKYQRNNLITWMGYLKSSIKKNSTPEEITLFLVSLYDFTNELVKAIKRCVKRQNLNEGYGGIAGFRFSDYGMQDVPIITKTYNAMVDGFNSPTLVQRYKTEKAAWADAVGVNKSKDNQHELLQQKTTTKDTNLVPPPNTRLQVILTQNYPLVQQRYNDLNRKYNYAVENMNPSSPKYILGEVDQIIRELRNAQGRTP